MTEDTTPGTKRHDRLEILIASLLGLAAILVAVAGYQASLRDGDSVKSFNEGIRATNDANGFYNEASQTFGRDQSLFLEYAKAAQDPKQADLGTYLHDAIMDDNLRGAVDEWQADDSGIATPLDAKSYAVPEQDEAERLSKVTDHKFAEARALDDEGDKYSLVGVIVASSLFFLGIAGVMSSIRTKIVGTAAGAISLAVAFGIWLTI